MFMLAYLLVQKGFKIKKNYDIELIHQLNCDPIRLGESIRRCCFRKFDRKYLKTVTGGQLYFRL